MAGWSCMDCGLPDIHNGDGDGIGSCECARCEECAAPPGLCGCHDDYSTQGWPND